MRTVKIENLSVGMVTGEPVRTRSGQIIVRQGSSLTNQMINHMNGIVLGPILVALGMNDFIGKDRLNINEQKGDHWPIIISFLKAIAWSVGLKFPIEVNEFKCPSLLFNLIGKFKGS